MRAIIACLALLGGAGVAEAHHAFSADFDKDVTGTIEGVVADVFYQNPHVHYFIEVTDAEGDTETWDAEGYNLGIMNRSGWSKDTVKVGDSIKVFGAMGRDGRRMIAIQRVEMSDGTVHAIFGG